MARNHEEDQRGELEALESIYYNELEGKSIVKLVKHVMPKQISFSHRKRASDRL